MGKNAIRSPRSVSSGNHASPLDRFEFAPSVKADLLLRYQTMTAFFEATGTYDPAEHGPHVDRNFNGSIEIYYQKHGNILEACVVPYWLWRWRRA